MDSFSDLTISKNKVDLDVVLSRIEWEINMA